MNGRVERAREAMRRLKGRPDPQSRELPAIMRRAAAGTHSTRQIRRLYWAQNLVWVWVGLAATLAGAQFFLDPAAVGRTAIGRALRSHLDYTWNAFFIIAGVLLIVGVFTRRSRVEMLGHWAFNAGLVPDAIAILVLTGGGPSFWITLGIGFASLSRLYYLVQTTEKRR